MARSWTTDAPSPDDAAAQYAIQERLRMARALREQSMQGASLENVDGQLVGNPIARALTSGLQGFSAGRQEKRALGDASALAGQQRERLAAALAGAGGQKTPDDMIAFGTKLLADPSTAEVGQFYVQAGQKAKQDAATQARQDAQFDQRESAAERRHRESMEAMAERARLAREAADARAAAKGANGADPYFTYQPVTDNAGKTIGMARYDARGGPPTLVQIPGLDGAMRPQDNSAVQGDLAAAKASGKEQGLAEANLADRSATLPRLEQVAAKLSGLGKLATYTLAGQARDAVMRQLGMDVPDAAVAREEYMKTIDNEVLPLLRETFGAQFTLQEGRDLRTTLGDPNKSPEEKDAALRAFIESKRAAVNTAQRRVGAPAAPPAAAPSDDDLVNKYLNGQP